MNSSLDPPSAGTQNALRLQIPDFTTNSDSEGKYTSFRLVSATSFSYWNVFKRYQNFATLHHELSMRFSNLLLPPLPKKKVLGSSREVSFVEERRVALEQYMQQLSAIPDICASKTFLDFLEYSHSFSGMVTQLNKLTGLVEKLQECCGELQTQLILANHNISCQAVTIKELQQKLEAGPKIPPSPGTPRDSSVGPSVTFAPGPAIVVPDAPALGQGQGQGTGSGRTEGAAGGGEALELSMLATSLSGQIASSGVKPPGMNAEPQQTAPSPGSLMRKSISFGGFSALMSAKGDGAGEAEDGDEADVDKGRSLSLSEQQADAQLSSLLSELREQNSRSKNHKYSDSNNNSSDGGEDGYDYYTDEAGTVGRTSDPDDSSSSSSSSSSSFLSVLSHKGQKEGGEGAGQGQARSTLAGIWTGMGEMGDAEGSALFSPAGSLWSSATPLRNINNSLMSSMWGSLAGQEESRFFAAGAGGGGIGDLGDQLGMGSSGSGGAGDLTSFSARKSQVAEECRRVVANKQLADVLPVLLSDYLGRGGGGGGGGGSTGADNSSVLSDGGIAASQPSTAASTATSASNTSAAATALQWAAGFDKVLQLIQPEAAQLTYRNDACSFFAKHVRKSIGAQLYETNMQGGCYLPHDPVVLSLMLWKTQEPGWYVKLNERLCRVAGGVGGALMESPQMGMAGMGGMGMNGGGGNGIGFGYSDDDHYVSQPHALANVSFTASTGGSGVVGAASGGQASFGGGAVGAGSGGSSSTPFKVQCVLDGSLNAEIRANVWKDLCLQAFLEEFDTIVGEGGGYAHLFKRSLLLVRAWWYYEVCSYDSDELATMQQQSRQSAPTATAGAAVSASAGGVLSLLGAFLPDAALCTMVCGVFTRYRGAIQSPLHALALFLADYSDVDFAANVVTADGIVPLDVWEQQQQRGNSRVANAAAAADPTAEADSPLGSTSSSDSLAGGLHDVLAIHDLCRQSARAVLSADAMRKMQEMAEGSAAEPETVIPLMQPPAGRADAVAAVGIAASGGNASVLMSATDPSLAALTHSTRQLPLITIAHPLYNGQVNIMGRVGQHAAGRQQVEKFTEVLRHGAVLLNHCLRSCGGMAGEGSRGSDVSESTLSPRTALMQTCAAAAGAGSGTSSDLTGVEAGERFFQNVWARFGPGGGSKPDLLPGAEVIARDSDGNAVQLPRLPNSGINSGRSSFAEHPSGIPRPSTPPTQAAADAASLTSPSTGPQEVVPYTSPSSAILDRILRPSPGPSDNASDTGSGDALGDSFSHRSRSTNNSSDQPLGSSGVALLATAPQQQQLHPSGSGLLDGSLTSSSTVGTAGASDSATVIVGPPPDHSVSAATQLLLDKIGYCRLLVDGMLTNGALRLLIRVILYGRGSLPVGEIGKLIQEATIASSITASLKEKYGGLKKFMEMFKDDFVLSKDHPYNPHVFLKDGITGYGAAAPTPAFHGGHYGHHMQGGQGGKQGGGKNMGMVMMQGGLPGQAGSKKQRRSLPSGGAFYGNNAGGNTMRSTSPSFGGGGRGAGPGGGGFMVGGNYMMRVAGANGYKNANSMQYMQLGAQHGGGAGAGGMADRGRIHSHDGVGASHAQQLQQQQQQQQPSFSQSAYGVMGMPDPNAPPFVPNFSGSGGNGSGSNNSNSNSNSGTRK